MKAESSLGTFLKGPRGQKSPQKVYKLVRNRALPTPCSTTHSMPPIIFEPTARRIRVEFNKVMIADSARAMIEIENSDPSVLLAAE